MNLKKLQKTILNNKLKKGFNTTNIFLEFCLISEELSEACRAYYRKLPNLGEELADVVIYILGLAEILGIDLEVEIKKKVKKNEKRIYKKINGVNTKINS